jgi:hypothetical protein
MPLKIIDQFDSSFNLDPTTKAALFAMLKEEAFRQQVAAELGWQTAEFTELLFQPVPYSTHTPRGMPPEFEKFYTSPDHAIVHVPPTFMFKAKITKPSRLCAIYRKVDSTYNL